MSILNKNIVKITSEDLKDATLSSASFAGETKKRAFANILGARLAIKLLFSKKIEANNIYSLYTIQSVLKALDVSDIYFENIKMDVRLVFNKNEIFVPKSHFENYILPDLYIPLLLKNDMSSAEILGFFEPKDIDTNNSNKDFYFFEAEKLSKPENLKKFISLFIQKTPKKSKLEDLQKSEGLFGDFIDDELPQEDKTFLIKQLNNNLYLREKLVELENFELLSGKSISEGVFTHDMVFEAIEEEKITESEAETVPLEDLEAPLEESAELIEQEAVKDFQEPLNEEIETSDLENFSGQEFLVEDVASQMPEQIQDLPDFTEAGLEPEEFKEELVSIDSLVTSEEIETLVPEQQENDISSEEFDLGMFDSDENKKTETDSLGLDNNEDLDEQVEKIISKSSGVTDSDKEFEKEDLKSQIDELLEDLHEHDESVLSEIEIIEDLVSSSKDKTGGVSELPEFETASEDDLEFITSESEPEVEKKDKDLINILFEKENIKATDDMDILPSSSEKGKIPKVNLNKKVVIAASVVGLLLVATVGGVIVTKNKAQNDNLLVKNDMNTTLQDVPADNSVQQYSGQNQYIQDVNMPSAPPPGQYQNQGRDMSKAVSDAFLSTPINATISKIAWEAPEDLAYSDSFRKYLQMAGKNLKLTLQNDLLLSSEMAYSNKVIVDISINKGGTIKDAKISVSSGSKQIDNIVLQSVKETLKYLKMPADEIQGSSVDLTLIINF